MSFVIRPWRRSWLSGPLTINADLKNHHVLRCLQLRVISKVGITKTLNGLPLQNFVAIYFEWGVDKKYLSDRSSETRPGCLAVENRWKWLGKKRWRTFRKYIPKKEIPFIFVQFITARHKNRVRLNLYNSQPKQYLSAIKMSIRYTKYELYKLRPFNVRLRSNLFSNIEEDCQQLNYLKQQVFLILMFAVRTRNSKISLKSWIYIACKLISFFYKNQLIFQKDENINKWKKQGCQIQILISIEK